jgi:hypothetical protein
MDAAVTLQARVAKKIKPFSRVLIKIAVTETQDHYYLFIINLYS